MASHQLEKYLKTQRKKSGRTQREALERPSAGHPPFSSHRGKTCFMSETNSDPAKGSSRNIYAFGATSLLNDTASEMAYWVLPAFLASIGAGPAQLGLIEGIAESVASFAKLLSGYLADRIPRRKPIVVSGYVVANAVKPLLALASSWRQVLAIRFADRFAKGIRGTARDVMVADTTGRFHMGSAYGLIQAMDSAGAIAGPLLALSPSAALRTARRIFSSWHPGLVMHRCSSSRNSRTKNPLAPSERARSGQSLRVSVEAKGR